jgi:hypothetical protein
MALRPILVAALLAGASHARAGRAEFVGARKCSGCHQKEARAWSAGPHASAGAALGDRAGDGACESCHGTGDAPAGRSYFVGVQCEACHGRGADYASEDVMRDARLARLLGLRDLSTARLRGELCVSCHVARMQAGAFDAEAAWKRIGH